MKVKIFILSHTSAPEIVRYRWVPAQTRVVWRDWSHLETDSVITGNGTFTFSHCTSASPNALEAHWRVIENAVRLVKCLHKSSWLLSCSFVDWQRLPVAFQEAVLPICSYMFWWGLCSVGCQEGHQDNKPGLKAEWGLSKLCCTRWIEKKK